MYQFVVTYYNVFTGEEIKKEINVDTTPLDDECRDHEPEYTFAWHEAVIKAYKQMKQDQEISGIEIISY